MCDIGCLALLARPIHSCIMLSSLLYTLHDVVSRVPSHQSEPYVSSDTAYIPILEYQLGLFVRRVAYEPDTSCWLVSLISSMMPRCP